MLFYNRWMGEKNQHRNKPENLRKGWTTGACATAATRAALSALITREFPDPVTITLPKGQTPAFALTYEKLSDTYAEAGIIKDAGDDPDVTHLAQIRARVEFATKGAGILFHAGKGVGTVTLPGLPVAIGEPAINPVPRQMMTAVIEELCTQHTIAPDINVTISVIDGEALALKTWNPRLGIIGGLSILGTTGIVNPFSCSAWIHSIHRGIDVSRATGITHVLGATGATSQKLAEELYHFDDCAILDMGDFVGGLLKYLRKNPIAKITLAGGFAKFSKLAQGAMDLHSGRSQVDLDWLAQLAKSKGATQNLCDNISRANTAMEALELANQESINLPEEIAINAQKQALFILRDAPVCVEIIITSRNGKILARHE